MTTETITGNAPKTRPLHEDFAELHRQFWDFQITLWRSPCRHTLTMLTAGIVAVIITTAVAQVGLNAWNRPFYDAIQQRDLAEFVRQLGVFGLLAGGLLILNVAQAWFREMIKVRTREALTRDLFSEWLKPGRASRLAYAGEIGINPDQRIHEDARHLTELAAELGIGLFQASLLLVSFLGVLWTISGPLVISLGGSPIVIPGYMVWCALLYAITGSLLTWWVGRSLVGLNAQRYQRESELRFGLVQANQQAATIAHDHTEEQEKQRLNLDLDNVLAMMRSIVGAVARLTWVTAGYGWVSIVAPIVIASPNYFNGKLSFGELMVVVGGFYQVNQSLRFFVDNFAQLADWRATLSRVMSFRETLLTFESTLGEERIEYDEHSETRLEIANIGVAGRGEKARLDADKVDVAPGDRVLFVDKTKEGKAPLLPALAGHWPFGSGTLKIPSGERVMILGPRPYFPKGPLRAALAYPDDSSTVSDADAEAALTRVGLDRLTKSLDRTARWWRKLSDDEQAKLALARLLVRKPKWVFTEGVIDTVADHYRDLVLSIFDNELADTAVVSISRHASKSPLCRRVFNLTGAEATDDSSRLPYPAEAG